MTVISDFSPEEAQLLTQLPFSIGTTMAMAGGSGLGTIKEAASIPGALMEGRTAFPNNSLIGSLVSSFEALMKEDREKAQALLKPSPDVKSPEELVNNTLAQAHEAVALLAQKATPEEADDYKRWMMQVAAKVAGAAKEGGFLGIGGTRISEQEQAALGKIAEALGTTYTAAQ